MTNVIAIVGRPNVGKSTLFNRLVRARAALVDPMAGLTRDLRENECFLGGRHVSLIDTAGLESDTKGKGLPALMVEQALKAVAAADLVLFVIDARSDLLPADEMWAQLLRTKAKKLLLVANKCENNKKSQVGKLDCLRLGLGDPIAISAEHNSNMGQLEEEIIQSLDAGPQEQNEQEQKRKLKLAVIGRPNAGKSSLINLLLGEQRQLTDPKAGTTRDAIGINWQWQGEEITLFDTAGLRRPSRIFARVEKLSVSSALQAIRFADIVVMLMDVQHLFQTQDLRLIELIIREGKGLVLAVNKIDLMPATTEADIEKAAAHYLPQLRGVPVVCLSVLSGKGADGLMPKVKAARALWNTQIGTPALNSWLQACVARKSPPQVGGRAVRIKYITQKSTRPPSFIIFLSRAKKLPDDYMRYLMNDMRRNFNFEGTPVRFNVRTSTNPYI